jgi:hypothetical protein
MRENSGANGSIADRQDLSLRTVCCMGMRPVGMQMGIDRHAQRRHSLPEQEQVHVGMGRERLEHAAGHGIDMGDASANLHAGGALHVFNERVESVLEHEVMEFPDAAGARRIQRNPPFDRGEALVDVHDEPSAVGDDRHARGRAGQESVLERGGGMGDEASETIGGHSCHE